MNIAQAIYLNSINPKRISSLILDILKGFSDTSLRNLNYFDLFIIIPYYSYPSAQKQFEKIIFKPINSFQRDVERNPNTFSNFQFLFQESIEHIKLGILYAFENNLINMNEELEIELVNKHRREDKKIFNMGRVFSTKTTVELFNFFEVDINAI